MVEIVGRIRDVFKETLVPHSDRSGEAIAVLRSEYSDETLCEEVQNHLIALANIGRAKLFIPSADEYETGFYCLLLSRLLCSTASNRKLIRELIIMLPARDWYIPIGELLHASQGYIDCIQGVVIGIQSNISHLLHNSLEALSYYSVPSDYEVTEEDQSLLRSSLDLIATRVTILQQDVDPEIRHLANTAKQAIELNWMT